MTKFLHFDFETRSMLDLKEVGLHNYARHWSAEPWCAAYAYGDDEVQVLDYEALKSFQPRLEDSILVAHNSSFELEIWNEICVKRWGWPKLRPKNTVCTMAAGYAMGLPGALEDAALALGLPVKKDMEGRALILRMARPRAIVDGKPIWWTDQDKIARGHAYCKTDVLVARELHRRVMPLGERERRVWLMDYEINRCGMMVDAPSAQASIVLTEQQKELCDSKLVIITDGAVQTVNALIALKQWLRVQAPEMDWGTLDKEDVTDALELELPTKVRAALLLRQEAGKASTAKLGPMVRIAGADDRMRNTKQYHGATTGRWAGRAIQPDNFPRDSHKEKDAETILRWIREGKTEAIEMIYDQPMTAISRCLKSYIRAPDGKLFNIGDFANIEGRGTAWVSGETWKLQAFRDADAGIGPGIYELSYSKSFGVPAASVANPSVERQIGKVSELSLGYQGGLGAFMRMGKSYGVKVVKELGGLKLAKGQFEITEKKVEEVKLGWRAAHPMAVAAWGELEGAAIAAIHNPGKIYSACGNRIKFRMAGSFLWCLLPSNRALCYPYPKIMPGKFGGPMVTFMAVPSAEDRKKGKIIKDPHNAPRWARLSTYGGSLMENVVQAICRDILVDKMLVMHALGWQIVLHVHDEIVAEEDSDRAAEMLAIMNAPVEWAPGFPVYVEECRTAKRYGK